MPKFNIVKVKVDPLGFEFPDIFIRKSSDCIRGSSNLEGPVHLFSDSTMAAMSRCYHSNKEFNKVYSDFYLLFINLVDLYEIDRLNSAQADDAVYLINEISNKAERLYHLME